MKKTWILLLCYLMLVGCSPKEGQEPAPVPEPEPPSVEDLAPPVPEDNPSLKGGVLVMIDNHSRARPQSGLDKADLVFEIIAEGGITRYMALFYTQEADRIGPVRSARYYFVELAKGYNLPYAHVGGSVDGLAWIQDLKVKDLNEMGRAAGSFWRDRNRRPPHNTYTSTEELEESIEKIGYDPVVPDLPPYAYEFDGEALPNGRLELTYATGRYPYVVDWQWEEGLGGYGGQYRRYINGEAQETAEGVPLVADTLYVLAARSFDRRTDPVTSQVDLVGEGQALCIVDNQMIRGKWIKENKSAPLRILDDQGEPLPRKVGKTWIQVINSMNEVVFE